MNRWPLLVSIPILALLAGTYAYYLHSSRAIPENAQDPEVDIGVEDFDAEDGSDVDVAVPLNNGELAAPGDVQEPASQAASATQSSSATDVGQSTPKPAVETIEDEETLGETVDEPTVIDDDEEGGTMELPSPPSTR